MKILVINSGSSSLKYQLIDMHNEEVLCKGLCERIGTGGTLTHKAHGKEWTVEERMPTHAQAFGKMLELMTTGENAVVASKKEIDAVGHRVAHGGEKFSGSIVVTEELAETVERLSGLAPLHNPPQLQGIRSAQKVFGPDVPQISVFDTAFHQTMPPKAYIYPIPYAFYKEHAFRRYGFHGTSFRFVSGRAYEFLGRPAEQVKMVACHLGSGSSIAAIDGGKSVDTSMGLTPLPGIVMGTRCGDIDPSLVVLLTQKVGKDLAFTEDLLNKKSGLLGVSGISGDLRDIQKAAEEGDERAQIAHELLSYQIKKYIGGYAAAMGGLDCLVFTGGIGENSSLVREQVCAGMEFLGIKIDPERNKVRGELADISTEDAKVRTLVVPTDEELMIARDVLALIS